MARPGCVYSITAKRKRGRLRFIKLKPYPLRFIETPGVPLSYLVEDKMRPSKDKATLTVNPSLALGGIPPEVFQYRSRQPQPHRLGPGVIDQYRVTEDKRSGSSPTRTGGRSGIHRPARGEKAVQVSVETVGIVRRLPEKYAE